MVSTLRPCWPSNIPYNTAVTSDVGSGGEDWQLSDHLLSLHGDLQQQDTMHTMECRAKGTTNCAVKSKETQATTAPPSCFEEGDQRQLSPNSGPIDKPGPPTFLGAGTLCWPPCIHLSLKEDRSLECCTSQRSAVHPCACRSAPSAEQRHSSPDAQQLRRLKSSAAAAPAADGRPRRLRGRSARRSTPQTGRAAPGRTSRGPRESAGSPASVWGRPGCAAPCL